MQTKRKSLQKRRERILLTEDWRRRHVAILLEIIWCFLHQPQQTERIALLVKNIHLLWDEKPRDVSDFVEVLEVLESDDPQWLHYSYCHKWWSGEWRKMTLDRLRDLRVIRELLPQDNSWRPVVSSAIQGLQIDLALARMAR